MNEYRIWISYNDDEQISKYGLHDNDTNKLFATHHNVEGKNINSLSPVYSDLVTLWYVWKNSKKSGYVGFSHFNKMFYAVDALEKGECQVSRILDLGSQTIYQHYSVCHNKKDMDIILSILDEKYGVTNPYSSYIKKCHHLICNNRFLMKWGDFTKLCKFLFPILDAFAIKCGCVTVDDWKKRAANELGYTTAEYQMRAISFVSERLVSAWIFSNLTPYVAGRDVAIVHYNTPELIDAAIKSLNKHTPGCRIYVFDNSDKTPFVNNFKNVKVLDNTQKQLVNFDEELEKYPNKWERDITKSNYGSAKHSMSVEYLMNVLTDGFVLMDSDVLIKGDIKALWNKDVSCSGSENVKHNVPLLMPFLCYLNVPMLKENCISYFNGDKMWALSDKEPNCHYDTGAWFLEQVREKRLPVEYVNIWQYVIHLGHGSWRGGRATEWLETNKSLYE